MVCWSKNAAADPPSTLSVTLFHSASPFMRRCICRGTLQELRRPLLIWEVPKGPVSGLSREDYTSASRVDAAYGWCFMGLMHKTRKACCCSRNCVRYLKAPYPCCVLAAVSWICIEAVCPKIASCSEVSSRACFSCFDLRHLLCY